MASNYTKGYIPPNIGAGGFKLRRFIETGIGLGILYFLYLMLLKNLPYNIGLYLTFIFGIAIFFITFFGIDSYPFSLWIIDLITYRKTRTVVLLKMPERVIFKEETENAFSKIRRLYKLKKKKIIEEEIDFGRYEGEDEDE